MIVNVILDVAAVLDPPLVNLSLAFFYLQVFLSIMS